MTLKNRVKMAKAYNSAPDGSGVGCKGHYQMSCFRKYSEDADVIEAIKAEEKPKQEKAEESPKKKAKKGAK